MRSTADPACPTCGLVLLVDAPINMIFRREQLTAEYDRVAVVGGWGGVLPPTSSLAEAAAVYFGDLITPAAECPRCGKIPNEVIERCKRRLKDYDDAIKSMRKDI